MNASLYLIVTPRLCRGGVLATTAAALDGGAGMVQLRDKEASDEEFARLASALATLCRARGVPLILNDRAHLVAATGADGVHVGEGDLAPADVRRRYGTNLLIGLSAHDRAELAAAAGRGADYAGLGPMFATETKALARAPGGAALVRAVAGATELPVFPVGGIDASNAPELIAAGATRLAVSAAICAAADPRAAAQALAELIQEL